MFSGLGRQFPAPLLTAAPIEESQGPPDSLKNKLIKQGFPCVKKPQVRCLIIALAAANCFGFSGFAWLPVGGLYKTRSSCFFFFSPLASFWLPRRDGLFQ